MLEYNLLVEKTRMLCWEQMVVLQKVLEYCKAVNMAKSSGCRATVKPPLLTVHGGGGTGKSMLINQISLWVHKILTDSGDDPCSP